MTISGKVESFATIIPKRVKLFGKADSEVSAKVSIIPTDKYPFKILSSHAKKGENIRLSLEEVKREQQPQYVLTISNTKNSSGRYFDTVYLKTDSKLKPELYVSIYGNITDSDGKPEAGVQ